MTNKICRFQALIPTLAGMLLFLMKTNVVNCQSKVLTYWRFEQIQHLKGDSTSTSIVGQPLTASDRGPAEPQPYVFDESGNGNFLQVHGAKPSTIVFSDNVPSALVNGYF
jgi:hypothetical protein